MKGIQKVKIHPPVNVFPWLPLQKEAYEHQAVMSDLDEVFVNGVSHDISKVQINAKMIQELFRSYVQQLELEALNKNPKVQEYAEKAKKQMYKVLEDFKNSEGIDLLGTVVFNPDISFKTRAMQNQVRHNQIKVKAFIENIELLIKGDKADQLNQFDAAKRIGVGTILGKYA